jgi:acyl-CoA thioesterase-1
MTGPEAGNNLRLEQYNQVIDEFLSENGITSPQPDFFCYFRFFPQPLSDNLHPNNAGYIAMAKIWSNILLGLSNTCVP